MLGGEKSLRRCRRHLLSGVADARATRLAQHQGVRPRVEVAEDQAAEALQAVGDAEVGEGEAVAEVVDGTRAHDPVGPVA